RVRVLDENGKVTEPSGDVAHTVVADTMVVSATVEDDECRFRAWRADGEVWSSATPCPGAPDAPSLGLTMGDRMFVRVGGDTGALSVDLHDGRTTPVRTARPHAFDPESLTAVAMSDQVIV